MWPCKTPATGPACCSAWTSRQQHQRSWVQGKQWRKMDGWMKVCDTSLQSKSLVHFILRAAGSVQYFLHHQNTFSISEVTGGHGKFIPQTYNIMCHVSPSVRQSQLNTVFVWPLKVVVSPDLLFYFQPHVLHLHLCLRHFTLLFS